MEVISRRWYQSFGNAASLDAQPRQFPAPERQR
jgi:hypothetical protein